MMLGGCGASRSARGSTTWRTTTRNVLDVWNLPRLRIAFLPRGTSTLLNDVAKSSVALDRELDEEKSKGPSDPRIRCPLGRWSCRGGHEWNTFDTGGVCPACLHQWTETQCLSCSRWSPHSLWYAG